MGGREGHKIKGHGSYCIHICISILSQGQRTLREGHDPNVVGSFLRVSLSHLRLDLSKLQAWRMLYINK